MSAANYIEELQHEKGLLDPREFQHAIRLIETEINNVGSNNDEKFQASGAPKQDKKYDEDVVIVAEKIMLPIEDYPRFNFVGRLLGPKGKTMKSLQEMTKTRISILGKGSTRDREKEEELSLSDDPKNEHFKEPLHITVSAKAPRSIAHERVAICLDEINKCLDAEGEVREEYSHMNGFDVRRHEFRGSGGAAGMPIIKVGIPPPGAIILNAQQAHAAGLGGKLRPGGGRGGGGRGRGGRSRPY